MRKTRTRINPIDRFLSKISINDSGCWNWTSSIDKDGYGQFTVDYKTLRAHKWSYEYHVAKVPHGLQLDHTCRNRKCVNPNHLEPVTCKINLARSPIHNINKTHCPSGHPYTDGNLFYYKQERRCRICNRLQSKQQREKA